jgi:NAD+ synthase (glutamine-hydrolysing)
VAGKLKVRQALAERIAARGNIPLVYVNTVGANDQILFDGRSFVITPPAPSAAFSTPATVTARAFEEDLVLWDLPDTAAAPEGPRRTGEPRPAGKDSPNGEEPAPSDKDPFKAGLSRYELDMLEEGLVMGIRDYMKKCGFTRAHLGLSGGIDSALVAHLGVRAAGAENITCFSMPSRFSSQGSRDDAAELAANLGCRYEILPIEPVFQAFLGALEGVFENRPFDIAEENLQARIRGSLLMGFSNKFNSMLLTTGNKSELAMGYCTLYGDMNGALGPIGDMFKTEVFALCRRINERAAGAGNRPPIPQTIIDKPPSAELRPNQKDQDSLPPYEVLDEILRLYLYNNLAKDEITRQGWDSELAARIIRTVARAEFKRRQAPPVLKVSPRAFGMGRRMPIARTVYEIGE